MKNELHVRDRQRISCWSLFINCSGVKTSLPSHSARLQLDVIRLIVNIYRAIVLLFEEVIFRIIEQPPFLLLFFSPLLYYFLKEIGSVLQIDDPESPAFPSRCFLIF